MPVDTRSIAQRVKDDITGLFGDEEYVPPIKRKYSGEAPKPDANKPEQPAIYTKTDWDGAPTADWKDKTVPVAKAAVVKPKGKPATAAVKVAATPAAPAPKVDDLAEVRADLLANQRADEAARAAAARKRQEAEDFSKKLKSATTRPAASKTGYDSYKSLMGE